MTHRKKLTKKQSELVLEHKSVAERIASSHSKWKAIDRPDREDLINVAYIALCEAAKTWKPESGPFRPWAIKKIKWAIQLEDQAHTHHVHVPVSIHNFIRDIRRAKADGAETIAEVAAKMNANPDKVRKLWSLAENSKAFLDEDTFEIPSSDVPTEEKVELNEEKTKVAFAISELPGDEQAIISARFGFITGLPMTSDEIAKHLGLSIEYVRMAEESAVEHLRAILDDW